MQEGSKKRRRSQSLIASPISGVASWFQNVFQSVANTLTPKKTPTKKKRGPYKKKKKIFIEKEESDDSIIEENTNFNNFQDEFPEPLPNPTNIQYSENNGEDENFIDIVEDKINKGLTPAEFRKLTETLVQAKQKNPELQTIEFPTLTNFPQTPLQASTIDSNVGTPFLQTPSLYPRFNFAPVQPLPSTPSNIPKPNPVHPPITPTRLIKDVMLGGRKNRRKSIKTPQSNGNFDANGQSANYASYGLLEKVIDDKFSGSEGFEPPRKKRMVRQPSSTSYITETAIKILDVLDKMASPVSNTKQITPEVITENFIKNRAERRKVIEQEELPPNSPISKHSIGPLKRKRGSIPSESPYAKKAKLDEKHQQEEEEEEYVHVPHSKVENIFGNSKIPNIAQISTESSPSLPFPPSKIQIGKSSATISFDTPAAFSQTIEKAKQQNKKPETFEISPAAVSKPSEPAPTSFFSFGQSPLTNFGESNKQSPKEKSIFQFGPPPSIQTEPSNLQTDSPTPATQYPFPAGFSFNSNKEKEQERSQSPSRFGAHGEDASKPIAPFTFGNKEENSEESKSPARDPVPPLFFGNFGKKDSESTSPVAPSFSFATGKVIGSGNEETTSSTPFKLPFSFGTGKSAEKDEQKSPETPPAAFSFAGFGKSSDKDKEEPKKSAEPEIPAGNPTTESFSVAFGANKSKDDEKTSPFNFSLGTFGKKEEESIPPAAVSSPVFSFGTSTAAGTKEAEIPAAPFSFTFGATKSASKDDEESKAAVPAFAFGTSKVAEKAEESKSPSSTPFNFAFGAKADSKAPASTFSFGATNPATVEKDEEPTSTTPFPFSFGATNPAADSKPPASTFSFGATNPATDSKPPATFSFGATNPAADSKPSATFSFGATNPAAGKDEEPSSSKPFSFSFGTSNPVTSNPLGKGEEVKAEAISFSFNTTPASKKDEGDKPVASSFSFGTAPILPSVPEKKEEKEPEWVSSGIVFKADEQSKEESKAPLAPTSFSFVQPDKPFSFSLSQTPKEDSKPEFSFSFGAKDKKAEENPVNPFAASQNDSKSEEKSTSSAVSFLPIPSSDVSKSTPSDFSFGTSKTDEAAITFSFAPTEIVKQDADKSTSTAPFSFPSTASNTTPAVFSFANPSEAPNSTFPNPFASSATAKADTNLNSFPNPFASTPAIVADTNPFSAAIATAPNPFSSTKQPDAVTPSPATNSFFGANNAGGDSESKSIFPTFSLTPNPFASTDKPAFSFSPAENKEAANTSSQKRNREDSDEENDSPPAKKPAFSFGNALSSTSNPDTTFTFNFAGANPFASATPSTSFPIAPFTTNESKTPGTGNAIPSTFSFGSNPFGATSLPSKFGDSQGATLFGTPTPKRKKTHKNLDIE